MRNRFGHRVKHVQNQPLSQSHLEGDVFAPGPTHEPGREKSDRPVRGLGLLAEEREDAEYLSHVRQLLARLFGKKTGGIEMRRAIEPVSALDARHFAVKKLIEDPADEPAVGFGLEVKPSPCKFVSKLRSGNEHFGLFSVTLAGMSMSGLNRRIISCQKCPRLRRYCEKVAQVKRRAYADQIYWGKPIPGFGDPEARLMLVGLAPAAHGANRTGRIFTGDRSGEWLYRALWRAGFANQPQSVSREDGLKLKDAFVTCVVRCAPPANKPAPIEIARCSNYLREELALMPGLRVWLALGGVALHGLWPLLVESGIAQSQAPRPKFAHGTRIPLSQGRVLLMSYHPSQQNTFTGRLTEPMFDSVFAAARELLDER